MKIFVYIAYSAFVFLFLGCGVIEKTTTETTEAVKIPAIVIHDTVETFIPYEVLIQNGIDIDSAQRAYFIEHCKGEMDIDKDGLRAKVSFLSKDNKGKSETIVQLTSEIEKKKQEIAAKKTVVTTEKTPGQWWIWTHSFLYQFLAAVFAVIALIFLQMKFKFLP